MNKVWKVFRDYNYKVSNCGEIIRIDTGIMLSQPINLDGYKVITLFKNGKRKQFKSHRVIAELFCEGYQENLVVNHKDGNKINNQYENLEWVTPKENMVHAINNKLFSNRLTPVDVIDIRETVVRGCSENGVAALAREYGVATATISRVLSKKCWDDDLMESISLGKKVGVIYE